MQKNDIRLKTELLIISFVAYFQRGLGIQRLQFQPLVSSSKNLHHFKNNRT